MVKKSILVICGKIVSSIFTFGLSIIIARFYGSHLMGLFFLAFTVMSVFSLFSKVGLDSGVLRFVSLYISENKVSHAKGTIISSFVIVCIIGSVLGGILYLFSDYVAVKVFEKQDLAIFLKVFAIVLPFFSAWGILVETLKGMKAFTQLVLNQNIIFPLGNVICVSIFFFLGGHSAFHLVSAYGFSVVIALLVAGYLVTNTFSQMKEEKVNYEIKNLLGFSLPLLIVSAISLFIYWIDTLMVGIMLSSKDVGVYTAASKISMIVPFFLVALGTITPPLFTEYYHKGKKQELEDIARTMARSSIYVSLPVAITFLLIPNDILRLFGAEYVSGSWALIFLTCGQIVNCAVGLVGQILVMTGHHRSLLIITLFSAFLNIVLNFVFIPQWGISGAAAATGLTFAVMNLLLSFATYKLLGIKAHINRLKPILLSAFGAVSIFLLSNKIIGHYLAELIFLFSYFAILLYWGLDESERKTLKDLPAMIGAK